MVRSGARRTPGGRSRASPRAGTGSRASRALGGCSPRADASPRTSSSSRRRRSSSPSLGRRMPTGTRRGSRRAAPSLGDVLGRERLAHEPRFSPRGGVPLGRRPEARARRAPAGGRAGRRLPREGRARGERSPPRVDRLARRAAPERTPPDTLGRAPLLPFLELPAPVAHASGPFGSGARNDIAAVVDARQRLRAPRPRNGQKKTRRAREIGSPLAVNQESTV